ncbi:uncharacterized protein LOC111697210 [Eurytemora carolleeae]|uniref:uncharacterized protein LOC111697210 n=1 Tax=Eurytemora carolleeae TaxID=1294199 RepID=UPI000C75FC34|nr:uncharacterized protein LOC111697210 [Eurytemora carolleeae]|eukprot:XP_023322885.1 uncharacterized protein LOC111697210 [Eurytemora affinis]
MEEGNQTTGKPPGPTAEETLFFRLASAVEGITLYIIVTQILPSIYAKRHRFVFYVRLGLTYLCILLLIIIRFYDFMETQLFKVMNNEGKMRFLLYGIGPLECVFDLSLVCLSLETILDVNSALFTGTDSY